jgi:tetratricopeptide (TPR) repeat protein
MKRTFFGFFAGVAFALSAHVQAMDNAQIIALWDFAKPAESEQRFREELKRSTGNDALELQTQIARTYSLRGLFTEAHALLDTLKAALPTASAEVNVRYLLERGRTFRSAKEPGRARPLFEEAVTLARQAKLEFLAIDAQHMVALVAPYATEQLRLNKEALQWAEQAREPTARRWIGPLWNNIGMSHRQAGDLEAALEAFRRAIPGYELRAVPEDIRIAHWQVAHTLRLLDRFEEALAIQLRLEQECAAAKAPDPYVFEELAALYTALGQGERAEHYARLQRAAQSPAKP